MCIAFVLALILSRPPTQDYSAYVDPAVCIVLSLILLRKPIGILKESFADLVDANPYAETANIVEEAAHGCVERYRLKAVQWVRVRKAGRRVFVIVSFVENPEESLEERERGARPSTSRWAGSTRTSTSPRCSGAGRRVGVRSCNTTLRHVSSIPS